MPTIQLRFDPALVHFLPRHIRGGNVISQAPETATLKHVIEALGVPHTEIGRLSRDGHLASLDERVTDETSVEVTAARDHDGDQPGFIADAHLGGLARLLRLAGFDTLYDNHFQDVEIAALAHDSNRIVLSRDVELLKHRDIARGCYLRNTDPERQFRELDERLGLRRHAKPFTLCLTCGLPLHPLEAERAAARVPAGILARHTRFSTCDGCKRVFWEGSHWQRMRARLASLLQCEETAIASKPRK